MIRLITIIVAACVITTQSSGGAVPKPPVPFVADYSRILWDQCTHETKDALCFIGDSCDASDLTKPPPLLSLRMLQKSDQKLEPCSTGILIRPISNNRWFFMLQFFITGIHFADGVRLVIKGPPAAPPKPTPQMTFAHCVPRPGEAAPEMLSHVELHNTNMTAHNTSFFDADRILCIFTMEADKINSIPLALDNSFRTKGLLDWAMVVQVKSTDKIQEWTDIKMTNYAGGASITSATIIHRLKEKAHCELDKTALPRDPKALKEYKHYTLKEVIADFNTLACEDPLAKLLYEYDDKIREVKENFCVPDQNKYNFEFVGGGKAIRDYNNPLRVACGVADCVHCDPLPVMPMPGGVVPLTTWTGPRNCPQYTCPLNAWMYSDDMDNLKTWYSEEGKGPECKNTSTGGYAWFANDTEIIEVTCALEVDCRIVSPLECKERNKLIKLRDGSPAPNRDCDQLDINKQRIKCPTGEGNIPKLRTQKAGKWMDLATSIQCDPYTGTWFVGDDPDNHFDHKQKLECHPKEISLATLPVVAAGVVAFILIPGLMIGCWCLCNYSKKRALIAKEREEKRRMDIRPISPYKPAHDNLGNITDIVSMDKEDFKKLIEEFQLYSIKERCQFLDNIINQLGALCEIDQFLMLFSHCVEMETDYRVWRRLVLGFKMLLIALNQVNKSRWGLKLNEFLKRSGDRLLERTGWDKEFDEDESMARLRVVGYHMLFITNCTYTTAHMMEEFLMTQEKTDPARRSYVWAFGVRYAGKFDDVRAYYMYAYNSKIPEDETVVKKWGSMKEHIVYALCCSKNHEHVDYILGKLINDSPATRQELLWAFRGSIEDCFDVRIAARDAFKRSHDKLKLRMPVATPEYQEIFEMFSRYACLDFTGEDNWLIQFVYSPGTYTIQEKKELPLALMAQRGESARALLKKCLLIKDYIKNLSIERL